MLCIASGMKKLSDLTDSELENNLRTLVFRERNLLHEALLHIQEVDLRKLYLRRARPNLWEYLTLDLRMSPGSAQRRIDASRLAEEIPQTFDLIAKGSIHLSQIAIMQKGLRQKKEKVSLEEKRALLRKLENISLRETEKIVAESLGLHCIRKTKVTPQADGTARLAITVKQETWANLERCRHLMAHKMPGADYGEIVDSLCSYYLEENDSGADPFTSESEVPPRHDTAEISQKLREYIFRRDKSCRYRDPETGRVCASTFQLEIDHIEMRCHGGDHHPDNLRLLCRAHNQFVAEEKLGENYRRR